MTRFRSFVDASGRYYTEKFLRHGADAAGVDWRDTDSQHLRFRELLRVAEGDTSFSINDYGCGYGALASWLRDDRRSATYFGFDVSRPMIEHARAEFAGRDDVRFVESSDELPVADYTVASGVFNVKLDAPDDAWREYVLSTIREMRARSRVGLAFNLLTTYSDHDRMRADLYYADPAFFFDFCKRELSRQVALLHDYGLWEFTMIVRLDPGA